ncbi:MAG: hypothetical protein U5O39_12285 [Gammaproteobacteria bacterium]|nr:hypothetical protein [Gammaproteobacteria bacterium]
MLLDGEVVEGLGQVEPGFDRVDRAQGAHEVDPGREVREALGPPVEPDAADDVALVIAVIEAEVLALGVGQRGRLGGEGALQRRRHDVGIVLARGRGVLADAVFLAAVGHVLGDHLQEG